MKTLILTRHAKSDWSMPGQTDYDRSLNQRGRHDAPMMGIRLKEKNMIPDLIIASPAKRAAETAILIAGQLDYPVDKISWKEKLYHAAPAVILDAICETEEECNSILLVAHNNGITDFANSLSGVITHDMPTCSMAAFSVDTAKWKDFDQAPKKLLFFDYPKSSLED